MRIQKGLDITESPEGYSVVSLHYRADPEKDTPEWLAQATKPYPGGVNNPYFRKEYEIDFEAIEGQPVYMDLWRDDLHLINPFTIPEGLNKYRVIDPGFRNPTCCLWVAVNYDDPQGFLKEFPPGAHFFFMEHYVAGKEIPWHRMRIKDLTGKAKIRFSIIDARAGDRTLAAEKSVYDYFRDNKNNDGIRNLRLADNAVWDGIQKVRENLKWEEDDDGNLIVKPKYYFFKTLTNTIREMKGYRWDEYVSDNMKNRKNEKESPLKKNDHAPDDVRYIANEQIKPTRRKKFRLPKYTDMQKKRRY